MNPGVGRTPAADRFHEIDLLRGLACLAVVAFHYLSRGPRSGWMTDALFPLAESVARYGYLGVHLFFMISGFVILLSAQGATPRHFVAARVARLYPAFWVAATLTAATAWAFGDDRFTVSVWHYLGNLSLFAHWFDVPYVDGAYWSLAIEMHFYICVWAVLRFKLMHRIELLLAAWLAVSLVNALRPMWPLEFWLNARWAPFFVAGAACFLVRSRGISRARVGLLLVAYGLALTYALGEALQEREFGAAGWRTGAIWAAVTLFFVVFGLIALGRWSARPSAPVLLLGALTYPVYLLHQHFGYMVYEKLRVLSGSSLVSLSMTTGITVLTGWLLFQQVEKRLGPRLKRLVLPAGTVEASTQGGTRP